MLTDTTKISRVGDTAFTKLDDQVVMMDVESGNYYGLNPVASRIWELTENPTTISEICQTLEREFDVTLEMCQKETIDFLEKLLEFKIIEAV